MGSRFFTFIPLIFLVSSTILLIFTVINGSTTNSPINALYWSETDTSGIAGAPFDKSRWTFYTLCGVQNGDNNNCLPMVAAYPYSPYDNFPTGRNDLPQDFITNRNTYYYLSRIAFSFLVIALVGSGLSLLITPLGFCFKSCGGGFAAFFTFITFAFGATGASCLTAAHAMGRKHFNDNGMQTNLGAAAFGILWAGVFCLLMAFIGCCMVCCGNNGTRTKYVDAGPGPGAAGEPVYYPNNNRVSNNYEGATYVGRQDSK
ncbi:uncharacterized protein J8A68_005889 [[Candida] subhashii]|uniref:Protein SUR7 n=1 Tax=[Candida] subhashii TaxID=561895 RepID=A0A8J5QFX9_9ASCO|nr:uncharacterized protein J8A68_005889 [[Candida] subhashii]KAG7660623.1 hypothetical protein J8A68_005889 [[Candida] subhashii]